MPLCLCLGLAFSGCSGNRCSALGRGGSHSFTSQDTWQPLLQSIVPFAQPHPVRRTATVLSAFGFADLAGASCPPSAPPAQLGDPGLPRGPSRFPDLLPPTLTSCALPGWGFCLLVYLEAGQPSFAPVLLSLFLFRFEAQKPGI